MTNKRTVLITGATQGIGYSLATRLIKKGCQVIGIARNYADFPGKLYTTDLMDVHSTEKLFQKISNEYPIDSIVNNIGFSRRSSALEIKLSDFDEVMAINLKPALQAVRIFAPGMMKKKFGRVVNISSRAILGMEGGSSYAAAKAALVAFTRCWALEFLRSGITVNAVAPGATETESFRKRRPAGSPEEEHALRSMPMGRFAKPEEIASAIAFFLSEESSFITGQTLFVDGGGSIGAMPF